MLIADTYLGNSDDEAVAGKLGGADPLTVTLSDTERRRSRVRTTTDDGTAIGITVPEVLSDSDVLAAGNRLVVVALESVETMTLTFDGKITPTHAVSLGHAIGNRHWDLTIKDDSVLLPVAENRTQMESFVRPLLPDGTSIGYEKIPPTTFDQEQSHSSAHRHSDVDDDGHDHPHHGHSHGDSHTPMAERRTSLRQDQSDDTGDSGR